MRLWIFFLFLCPVMARAEYRAYELTITDTTTNQSRVVLSTLDHLQYPTYYHLRPTEKIEIKSTWRCLERSDYFLPICPNPRANANAPANSPATPPPG